MPERLIYHVPLDYAEAVGRAAIGWAHLETALETLVAVAAPLSAEAPEPDQRPSENLPHPPSADHQYLRDEWRAEISSIAEAARKFQDDLRNATYGTIYGRGVESAALRLRSLYETTQTTRIMSRMTTAKINKLSEEMAKQTRRAIELATIIVDSRRKSDRETANK